MCLAGPSIACEPRTLPPYTNTSLWYEEAYKPTQELLEGSGISPKLVVAMAALETGWGRYVKGGNYFGIKGEGQSFKTREYVNGEEVVLVEEFRRYDDYFDSVRGLMEVLGGERYEVVFITGDAEEQAIRLQAAGYATDPHYAKKLISILRGFDEDIDIDVTIFDVMQ